MNFHPIITAVLLSSIQILEPILAAESPSKLLQQGIFAEETEGDLEAAAVIYGKIVTEAHANRPIVAQAIFRLAMCHLKTGRQQSAIPLIRRLLTEFPGESEINKKAKQILTDLGVTTRRSTTQLVWDNAKDSPGSVSRDGRYLSFVEWSTGNLAIRDLTTGMNRFLTSDGTWDGLTRWALDPKFSPDDSEIAYYWYQNGRPELRLIAVEGGEPRVFYPRQDSPQKFDFQLGDWTQDGKRIYVQIEESQTPDNKETASVKRISEININTGAERVITNHAPWIKPIKLSPDGRYLAYSEATPSNKDVFVTTIASGAEHRVIQHPANDTVIGWAGPTTLLFTSDRSSTYDLWSTTVYPDGNATSPIKRTTNIGNIQSIGNTIDGTFYYLLNLKPTDLFVAEMNWEKDSLQSQPELLLQQDLGRSAGLTLSPSGRKIMYSATGSQPSVCVMELDSGRIKSFGLPQPDWRTFSSQTWSPDENHVVAFNVSPDGEKSGLFSLNLIEGQSKDFALNQEGYRVSKVTQFSKDSQQVYYIQNSQQTNASTVWLKHLTKGREGKILTVPGGAGSWDNFQFNANGPTFLYPQRDEALKTVTLIAHNLTTQEEHELLTLEGNPKFIVSPDFRWLLVLRNRGLGGERLEIHRIKSNRAELSATTVAPSGWNKFGDRISRGWAKNHFLLLNKEEKKDDRILSLNLNTGKFTDLGISLPQMFVPHAAPDSNKFYYWGYLEKKNQIWKMNHTLQTTLESTTTQ